MAGSDAHGDVLERLYAVIQQRKQERPEGSYVVRLLEGGHPALAKKLCEAAAELAEAAIGSDPAPIVHEAADVLFHLLVLLGYRDVSPDRVLGELERRFGTGGLVEKSRRSRPDPC